MKTRTRRNLLRLATATAVVCTAALVFVPALAAYSSPAPLPGVGQDRAISSIRIG